MTSMTVPRDIEARKYYRVALQRLDDGTLILNQLGRANAAVYLAGYATECILKALVLASTPAGERRQVLASFIGGKGHDLEWLNDELKRRGIALPKPISRHFSFVKTWTTNLRYDPAQGDPRSADRFIASTEAIVEWAKGRF